MVPVLVVARGGALPRRPLRERPRLPRDPHRQADLRERAARAVLRAHPAGQLLRAGGRASGCSQESEPLFDPRPCRADLEPQDVSTWKLVADRGPHAAGHPHDADVPREVRVGARARRGAVQRFPLQVVRRRQPAAHAVDRAEPDGAPGLQDVPRDARAARGVLRARRAVELRLPAAGAASRCTAPTCKLDKNGKLNGGCNALYDAAFADAKGATLRSAYGSPEHADETPAGAGRDITQMPEFAAVRGAARDLVVPRAADDAGRPGAARVADRHLRALRATACGRSCARIVRSDAYRQANNLASTTWRGGAP